LGFFEEEVLKGKYFTPKSRDRLRATMVNLFIFVGSFVMLLYAYENMIQGYYMMLGVDLFTILILLITYLIFPHFIGLINSSYMILGALTFLLSLSLIVPDRDPELSLFGLAGLPVFVFFFLGVKKGIRWSINMFIILLFIPLISYGAGIEFVYDWELLSQIVLGYLAISYMVYIIENERSSYEHRLNIALEENTILFKEVHHRTKNNMQVIMSLLERQAFTIDNPKYKKMFEAHIDRLKAMSMMHKNLYTNHSYEEVNIQAYLEEIAQNLQTYTEHTIRTDINSVWVDMKVAMNLGLIFNEAVTNAIEHAFGEQKGMIKTSFKTIGTRHRLCIQDNGKGFDVTKIYQSLGITLIRDLGATLHRGIVDINADEGVKIVIYFDTEEV